ncbi:MAG: PAS domain-containing protein, partial [Actinomycetota bacterium]|nr:PAS domain-containing protein [Actinomycetota bacterium]
MTTPSRASLAAVLEALPVAVVTVDGTMIVGWNPAAEVLYGYPAAEAIGCSVLEVLFDPDDRSGAAQTLESARGGQAWEGDCRVRRRDGVLLVSLFRAVSTGCNDPVVAWIAA